MAGEDTGSRAGLTRLMQGRCGGKVRREKQAGEEYRNTGGTHRAKRILKPRKHNETRQNHDRLPSFYSTLNLLYLFILNDSEL